MVWANEVHRLLTYYITSCYIKRVAGDTFVFQQDSTPANRRAKRSNCWSAKPLIISLRICGPPTALTSIWSITSSGGSCNSTSIRRRSRMWMNSRCDWLKSGLVWSRTLTLLSMHGDFVYCHCFCVFQHFALLDGSSAVRAGRSASFCEIHQTTTSTTTTTTTITIIIIVVILSSSSSSTTSPLVTRAGRAITVSHDDHVTPHPCPVWTRWHCRQWRSRVYQIRKFTVSVTSNGGSVSKSV